MAHVLRVGHNPTEEPFFASFARKESSCRVMEAHFAFLVRLENVVLHREKSVILAKKDFTNRIPEKLHVTFATRERTKNKPVKPIVPLVRQDSIITKKVNQVASIVKSTQKVVTPNRKPALIAKRAK